MKSKVVFSFIVAIVFLIDTAAAQFRPVPMNSGVAISSSATAVRGSFALGGGGVILRGQSKCKGDAASCTITSLAILAPSANRAELQVETKLCAVHYAAPPWMIKDAVALVDSENATVYRNVNLLGDLTEAEKKSGLDDDGTYWVIELSDALLKKRAGELLIAIDLMLTDPDFYSNFKLNRNSDAVTPINATARLIAHSDSAIQASSPRVKAFEDALGALDNSDFSNWTWNDESSRYTHKLSCESHTIAFTGTPTYTFLRRGPNQSLIEDKVTTKFFSDNYQLIINLNSDIYNNAIQFARLAAFLRQIKSGDSTLWSQLVNDSQKLPESHGSTPRLISRE
jgi:hypothetical protein